MKYIRLNLLLIAFSFISSYAYSQEDSKNRMIREEPKVRFAVLADRTGGEDRGIFKKIIGQMNTLSPDFVVSIGDVIDGYTTDESYLNRLWNEFDSLTQTIKVPFYIAPGNHDVSNSWMEAQWRKRFGCTYQAVDVSDNLFLFLNTDDGGTSRISQQQIDYFRHCLNKYSKEGWIYIFMHRPLWKYEEKSGYEKIEELLRSRDNVIVFSGHEHHYVMNNREGRKYYMLSTSGGGNNLRSNSLGEFHHFFFVTMDKTGPQVSNILLNGIAPESIVNEENEKTVSVMRNQSWFYLEPTLLQDRKQREVSTQLVLSNDATVPVRIKGKLPFLPAIQFSPSEIDTIIPAQSKGTILLNLLNGSKTDLLDFPIKISLEAGTNMAKEDSEIVTHLEKIWELDVPRVIQTSLEDEWINVRPGYIQEDWDWKGDSDGKFRFSLSSDQHNLILKINAFDDHLIFYPNEPQRLQDKFFVKIVSADDRESDNFVSVICVDGNSFLDDNYKRVERIKGNVSHADGRLSAKLIIPKQLLGSKYNRIRLNIGFMDHDNELNTKPSVLWWNTLWNTKQENKHSGFFLLNN